MIAEMAETKERIHKEFSEGCAEISKKHIGKPLTKDTLEAVKAETAELIHRIAIEMNIKITPGEVTATESGSVTIEEPYLELQNGERCRLSDWLSDL